MPKTFAVVEIDRPLEDVQDALNWDDLAPEGDSRVMLFKSDTIGGPENFEKMVKMFEEPDHGPALCKAAGLDLPPVSPELQKLDELLTLVKGQDARIAELEGQPGPRRVGQLVEHRGEGDAEDLEKSGDDLTQRQAVASEAVLGRPGTVAEALDHIKTERQAAGGRGNLPPGRDKIHEAMLTLGYSSGVPLPPLQAGIGHGGLAPDAEAASPPQ